MIDIQTLVNLGLVVIFVLIGGVFAATEIALVSLRDSQLTQLEQRGSRVVDHLVPTGRVGVLFG